jgi:hypothetical protein
MPGSYNDAKHRRHRAAEMRALSANMKDMEAAEMMLPDDYDKFADRADIRSNAYRRAEYKSPSQLAARGWG